MAAEQNKALIVQFVEELFNRGNMVSSARYLRPTSLNTNSSHPAYRMAARA